MKNLEVIRMQAILFLIGVLYPYYSFSIFLITDVHFHWLTTFPVAIVSLLIFYRSIKRNQLPSYYKKFILFSALSAYPQYVQLMLENPQVGELILTAHMAPAPWFIAQANFRHAIYYALGTIVISLYLYLTHSTAPVHMFSHINSMLTIYGVLGLVLYIYGRYQEEIGSLKEHLRQQNTKLANQAEELAEISGLLNQQCMEQASAIEQSSVSLDKMRTSAQHNQRKLAGSVSITQKFIELTDLANNSKQEIIHQFESLEVEIGAMDETIQKNIKAVQTLARDLSAIDKATEAVQAIVMQTQILSFNAAIEAGRAQQFGKGFAAIANQIKSLSLKSGEAASTIDGVIQNHHNQLNQLLNTITREMSEALASIHHELYQVRTKIDGYSKIFAEVRESSSEIEKNTDDSLRSTAELSRGFDQIASAGVSLKEASCTINQSTEKTKNQIDALKAQITRSKQRIATIECLVIDDTKIFDRKQLLKAS
jgi:methyl-accepting chemotaxis protein